MKAIPTWRSPLRKFSDWLQSPLGGVAYNVVISTLGAGAAVLIVIKLLGV
jgi:hypothetical protein